MPAPHYLYGFTKQLPPKGATDSWHQVPEREPLPKAHLATTPGRSVAGRRVLSPRRRADMGLVRDELAPAMLYFSRGRMIFGCRCSVLKGVAPGRDLCLVPAAQTGRSGG